MNEQPTPTGNLKDFIPSPSAKADETAELQSAPVGSCDEWLDPAKATILPDRPPPSRLPDSDTQGGDHDPRRLSYFAVILGTIGIGLILAVFLVYRAIAFYSTCNAIHPGLAILYAIGLALATLGLMILTTRSIGRYRRVRHVEALQRMVREIRTAKEVPHALRQEFRREVQDYLRMLERSDPKGGSAPRINRAMTRMDEHGYSPKRVVEQLEEFVLDPLDKTVDGLIEKRAREAAVATSLASGVLDPLILMTQAWRLVDEVSSMYGGRPGFLGSLRLLRRGLAAAMFAEVAEWATEGIAEALSTRAVAVVGARMGQGVANYFLLKRLGRAIKWQCRPVPLSAELEPAPLAAIFSRIFGGTTTQDRPAA